MKRRVVVLARLPSSVALLSATVFLVVSWVGPVPQETSPGTSSAETASISLAVSHLPEPSAVETRIGRVTLDFAPVHGGPGPEHPVLWRLYEGTQVAILDTAGPGDNADWQRIRLWNAYDGWLSGDAVSFEPYPPPPALPPPAPSGEGGSPPLARPPQVPEPLFAPATVRAPTTLSETADGEVMAVELRVDVDVIVDAWAVGSDGRVRYRVLAEGASGWASPGAVALQAADAATRQVDGRAIVEPLSGVGIWFVLDSREHGTQPGPLVAAAARANGVSHLYVEVATSRGGFFGRRWLDELLPAARAAGVRVIGSVYTWLDDVPADLDLALQVARYRTPDGLSLDGMTADVEETLLAANIQAFGELLRYHLGDDYLLVATVYPPESWAAPRYPWAALPVTWNAVAPMAYWRHMEGRSFTPAEVYAYTLRNVAGVRALAGRPDLAVEMLGQLFELGRPRLLGPDPPRGAEVEAAAVAARDAGAVGISFFDWARATPEHWEVLSTLAW